MINIKDKQKVSLISQTDFPEYYLMLPVFRSESEALTTASSSRFMPCLIWLILLFCRVLFS